MRRTILALFVDPADEPPSSAVSGASAITVDEAQQTLNGLTVYSGQAAHRGTREAQAPQIDTSGDDIEISEVETMVDDPKLVNWFAVPDANPGFAAFDTSDCEFARTMLSKVTGGWVEMGAYRIDAFAEHLRQHNPHWWQVGWSDNEESAVWYPGDGSDEDITQKGLREHKSQIGFEYRDDHYIRGTVAESGYCSLFSPSGWEVPEMAAFIGETMLQFSGVPNMGTAQEIANGDIEFEAVCAECGRDSDDLEERNDELLCPVCLDKIEEEETGGEVDDDQATLESEEVSADA